MSAVSLSEIEKLEVEDFLRISDFIQEHYGIQLPLSKMKMVEARLQKRLKALKLLTFHEYLDFVFSAKDYSEYVHMIDLITTNKTEFFRESAHFDFLTAGILPGILATKKPQEEIKIWSAACSTGEEVYSILITLEEYFFKTFKAHPYKILGTDLSTHVLKRAAAAIYAEERIADMPLHLKKRYFLKSKNQENPTARIKPSLLKSVDYKRLNLLKPFIGLEPSYDIIFCRNVLIYFSREVQQEVVSKLASKLVAGGYLFIGHSESLTNMQLPLMQVRPTLYKKI